MKQDHRKTLMNILGGLVAFALAVLWAVLVFAPPLVLERVELRLAVCLCFALEILYSWLRKKYLPEGRTPAAVKALAVGMIAVLLLRLLWICIG